jgi:hypothetical protein
LKTLIFFLRAFFLPAITAATILSLFSCSGQKKRKDPYAFSATTDFYNAEKFESKSKKRDRYLYAYDMKKVLYGNTCVTEVTKSFGFEYIPAFDSPDEPRNDLAIWAHNFTTSVAIAFRHGIFWKRKVKKKIRFCAETSGDFNG